MRMYLLGIAALLCAGCVQAAIPTSLSSNNFTSHLESFDGQAAFCIEFYAHWCPHCQHFAPTYEQVAGFFADHQEQAPVQVARADCADPASFELCKRMSIPGYPAIMFGHASQFITAMADGTDKSGLHLAKAENTKNASAIVRDILEYFKVPPIPVPDFAPAHPQPPAHLGSNVTAPDLPATHATASNAEAGSAQQVASMSSHDTRQGRADPRDMAAATIQTYHEMLETDGKLPSQREPFLAFWTLAAQAHPVPACRYGALALLRALPEWWPKESSPDSWQPPQAMIGHTICGAGPLSVRGAEQQYFSCAGSREGTRGYTCGMWMLLHSMAVGLPLDSDAGPWLRGLRAYIEDFFRCQECQRHFLEMLDGPQGAASVHSREGAVMWMWDAHNSVNTRLAQEESEQGTGDPAYPKAQWPASDECAACRTSDGSWNRSEISSFLQHFYAPVSTNQADQNAAGDTNATGTQTGNAEGAKQQRDSTSDAGAAGSAHLQGRNDGVQKLDTATETHGRGAEDADDRMQAEQGADTQSEDLTQQETQHALPHGRWNPGSAGGAVNSGVKTAHAHLHRHRWKWALALLVMCLVGVAIVQLHGSKRRKRGHYSSIPL